MTSRPIDRIVFTDGSNGIVRLPPLLWRAFYEAALYLEIDSVQECFVLFLLSGGMLSKYTDFVVIVEYLETVHYDREMLKIERRFIGSEKDE